VANFSENIITIKSKQFVEKFKVHNKELAKPELVEISQNDDFIHKYGKANITVIGITDSQLILSAFYRNEAPFDYLDSLAKEVDMLEVRSAEFANDEYLLCIWENGKVVTKLAGKKAKKEIGFDENTKIIAFNMDDKAFVTSMSM
jgi:hypothetical protein